MLFDLLPEHEALARVAQQVAADLAPGYVERDRAGAFDRGVLKLLAEADLIGLNIPAEAGGQGAGFVALGVVNEQLAGADNLAASIVLTAWMTGTLLARHGDPELASTWVPRMLSGDTMVALGLTEPQSGSDLRNITTVARRIGGDWVLRGEKSSVSFRDAGAVVVLAATDEGPSLFLVDDLERVARFPLDDLGMRSGTRAVMILDDVHVPARNRIDAPSGLKAIFETLTAARLVVAMQALGIGRAALDEAVQWVKDRVTFNAPLATRQGVAFPLVDHWAELELGRTLTLKGLWLADEGRPHGVEAAMAKLWVVPKVAQLCHDALLLAGHVGFTRDYPAQIRLRDVLGLEIGEGAANVQRIILARHLLGVTPS